MAIICLNSISVSSQSNTKNIDIGLELKTVINFLVPSKSHENFSTKTSFGQSVTAFLEKPLLRKINVKLGIELTYGKYKHVHKGLYFDDPLRFRRESRVETIQSVSMIKLPFIFNYYSKEKFFVSTGLAYERLFVSKSTSNLISGATYISEIKNGAQSINKSARQIGGILK